MWSAAAPAALGYRRRGLLSRCKPKSVSHGGWPLRGYELSVAELLSQARAPALHGDYWIAAYLAERDLEDRDFDSLPAGFFAFADFFRGNLYSNSAIRTFLPLNFTPSISSRKRWSRPPSPGIAILPPAATTRCQGSPCDWLNVRTTCRAPPGKPAARAIAP